MDFCKVEFETLAAALNLLVARNPEVDIEDLKPLDLLAICRKEFNVKFESQLKDAELADQLFEHMSDNYVISRHKNIHLIKVVKGFKLVGNEIQLWADFVGHPATPADAPRFMKLSHVRQAKPVADYLAKNLMDLQEVYDQTDSKHRMELRQFLSANPETKPFAKMLDTPMHIGVKSVKLVGKKVQVSTEEGENWDLPLVAVARVPEIAEQLLNQLVK